MGSRPSLKFALVAYAVLGILGLWLLEGPFRWATLLLLGALVLKTWIAEVSRSDE